MSFIPYCGAVAAHAREAGGKVITSDQKATLEKLDAALASPPAGRTPGLIVVSLVLWDALASEGKIKLIKTGVNKRTDPVSADIEAALGPDYATKYRMSEAASITVEIDTSRGVSLRDHGEGAFDIYYRDV
jgi:hypothetical protein